jgi:hypothetical protein
MEVERVGNVRTQPSDARIANGQEGTDLGGKTMTAEFQVQKAGLTGQNWTTICRGSEDKAREIYLRQLRLYSIGRFRLLDADGKVVEEGKAHPLFSAN